MHFPRLRVIKEETVLVVSHAPVHNCSLIHTLRAKAKIHFPPVIKAATHRRAPLHCTNPASLRDSRVMILFHLIIPPWKLRCESAPLLTSLRFDLVNLIILYWTVESFVTNPLGPFVLMLKNHSTPFEFVANLNQQVS